MARPGTVISVLDTPSSISLPTDTGTLLITGLTDRGPVVPTLVQSLADFVNKFGSRQSYSILYDYLETFFREGGARAYIGRVVGPGATVGTRNLLDGGAAISLVVSAIGPGAWSANYKVAVYSASGGYGIQVTDASNVVLEDSGTLADQASAVAWSQNSNYVRIALGVSTNNPAVLAATALSAGTDDRASITDTQWQNEQDLFTDDYGPGQVAQCGRTTTVAHTSLTNHAETHDRVALLDLTDSPTVGTLTGNLPVTHTRFSAAYAPWVTIPGLSVGTVRIVPASALIAGLVARNDPRFGPNAPAAGDSGQARFVNGLTQPAWSDANRQTLNTAGVNVIRQMLGGFRVYGWRSLADPINDLNWLNFGNARLYMALNAELHEVAEQYIFQQLTEDTINQFHDGLAGVLLFHYNQGELFGDSADLAFAIDTGPVVNTAQTIQNLELHAIVYVKMNPFAEWVQISVVKRQITDSLT